MDDSCDAPAEDLPSPRLDSRDEHDAAPARGRAAAASADTTDAQKGASAGVMKFLGIKGRSPAGISHGHRLGRRGLRLCVNMNHPRRGQAIIINNKDFEKHTGMNTRRGTDLDANNLYRIFSKLGFETKVFDNLPCRKILSVLQLAAREDHRDVDCFACAILSHGEEGVIYGTDGHMEVTEVTKPFRGDRCPGLVGKPKLFFLQACRGNEFDHGVDMPDALPEVQDELDAGNKATLPAEADFLLAYSTVPGYYSWRNPGRGSWYIQALCAVLEREGTDLEIMQLLTRVNKLVAYDFHSNSDNPYMNRKKQIPCIMSMLTKDLFLSPKSQ
uniref:AmphiCASP-3/7 n=1 Tax=Branchiostoma floridae TaxID=7739 RepID=Q8ITP3_BRAFL|nr:amphiCASP-3/7 [Branchiostoma floridae]